MTVTLTKPEWGVRCTSPTETVDVRAGEADARRWLGALHFCGNRDAVLVTRTGDGPWRPVETAATAGTDTSGAITPENLAEVIANLDAYIADRADCMAEVALARTKTEADQRVDAVRKQSAVEIQRQEVVIEELRRQLAKCDRIIARHGELAEALGVPAHTPWELLIAEVRKQGEASTSLIDLSQVKTWRNEDGKEFVFVDDLLTVLHPDQPTNPLNAQDGASRG